MVYERSLQISCIDCWSCDISLPTCVATCLAELRWASAHGLFRAHRGAFASEALAHTLVIRPSLSSSLGRYNGIQDQSGDIHGLLIALAGRKQRRSSLYRFYV